MSRPHSSVGRTVCFMDVGAEAVLGGGCLDGGIVKGDDDAESYARRSRTIRM